MGTTTITSEHAGAIGRSVRRLEDPGLVTGSDRFTGDLVVDGMLHVAFVRSPMAHATIRATDLDEARAMPGVVRILTGDDLPPASESLRLRAGNRIAIGPYCGPVMSSRQCFCLRTI